jgi:vacuolar-type H+-ATPase subunit H
MDILEQIDKLEAMASQAKRMPITGAAMIDAERLVSLIDQMRLAVPRNVQEAQEVLERREQIINQTMLDARRIRAVAETDARSLVDESELIKSAKKRGDEIVAEAEQKAVRMIQQTEQYIRGKQAGADQYAQESLAGLEEQVLSILNVIHAGQRILSPADEMLSASDLTQALEADKAS